MATYASRCIENEILMFLRKTSKLRLEVSLDEPLKTDWDGNELLLSDVLGTRPDTVSINLDQEIEREILRDALEHLGAREKRIIMLRFGLGGQRERTQSEVADLLGISQSYISRLEKRILNGCIPSSSASDEGRTCTKSKCGILSLPVNRPNHQLRARHEQTHRTDGGGTAGHVTPHLSLIPHLREAGYEIHYRHGARHRAPDDGRFPDITYPRRQKRQASPLLQRAELHRPLPGDLGRVSEHRAHAPPEA